MLEQLRFASSALLFESNNVIPQLLVVSKYTDRDESPPSSEPQVMVVLRTRRRAMPASRMAQAGVMMLLDPLIGTMF